MAHICLIQTPVALLRDDEGKNFTDSILIGSTPQALIGSLEAAGHSVTRFSMRDGTHVHAFDSVSWNGKKLHPIALGKRLEDIPLDQFDVFGITSNFHMEQAIVLWVIEFLSKNNKKVVVGGTDAIAQPERYLQAGATVVVLDKSGGSNAGAIEIALTGSTEKPIRAHIQGVGQVVAGSWRLTPNNWQLPSVEQVRGLLENRWRDTLPQDRFPFTSLVLDYGCDQACDFCMTRRNGPYGLSYSYMSPDVVGRWLELQCLSGARTVNTMSDQFLGRLLWEGGRDVVFETMRQFRERGLSWMFRNGIEISKLTKGVSIDRTLRIREESDLTPDVELVQAVYGEQCIQAFIPLERPLEGTERYQKLMHWRGVVEMCKAIVRSGAPDLLFGVIIGLREDSHESLSRLDEALAELKRTLQKENPEVRLSINPTVLIPFPGIPLTDAYKRSGLMPDDPHSSLVTKFTPTMRTDHLSINELVSWQRKLCHHMDPGRWANRGVTAF